MKDSGSARAPLSLLRTKFGIPSGSTDNLGLSFMSTVATIAGVNVTPVKEVCLSTLEDILGVRPLPTVITLAK